MKKFTFLLSLCLMGMGLTATAQETTEDLYPVSFDKTLNKIKTDRRLTSATLVSPKHGTQTLTLPDNGNHMYDDLTETTTWKMEAGEEVSINLQLNSGAWICGYVYIDTDNDGFTAGIDSPDGKPTAENYAPTGDLYSYSLYSGDESNGDYCYNSHGDYITGDARGGALNPPSFTAPTKPGVYRMRLKLDWNSINPQGNEKPDSDGESMRELRGGVTDLMVEITEPVVDPTPVSIDEVCAAAQTALEMVGVGYPAEDSEARVTLQNAIDRLLLVEETATQADVDALYDAIDAYKSTTEDIQLPTAGKLYSFTMVAKNGNRFYLNYTGEDVTMVARTDDAEIPETAKYECLDNGDGTFSFKTHDGKWLVNHGKYAGFGNLENGGSKTGFQEEKDEVANVTIAKLLNGNNVVAASQADLFGFVSWYGIRGYDINKKEDVYGYMVLKTDGSDYDGASVPFWNDLFSSAFLMEEYEKPVVPATVEFDPAPGHYDDGLPATVTMTCSKNISEVESVLVRTDVTFRGAELEASNYTVADNVITVNIPEEYLTDSEYLKVVIVAKDADGAYIEYGEYPEQVQAEYTTTLPRDVFVCTSITPAEEDAVTELSTFTLVFTGVYEGDMVGGFANEADKQMTLQDADGKVVRTVTLNTSFEDGQWNWVIATLNEPVTEAGTYTLVLPEGLVFNGNFDDTADDYGVSNGAIYNPAASWTYTVRPATGINRANVAGQKASVYTIAGRKVTETDLNKLGRGVYIVNGKKVVVK